LYSNIEDNNPIEAVALMKHASVLLEYHESRHAEHNKLMGQFKAEMEATKAKRSLQLSSKVEEGKRLAACDEEVKAAIERFNQSVYVVDMELVRVNMLKRIYYDCKMLFENSSRVFRESRNG
jgi:hypothetical protein